jgi:flagellar motor switch protein FliN
LGQARGESTTLIALGEILMPEDDTATPQDQDNPSESQDPVDAANDETPESPENQDAVAQDSAPQVESEPPTAAEQLAQDALNAARTAVQGINSGETVGSPADDETQAAIAAAQQAVDGIGTQVSDAVGDASAFQIPDLTSAVLNGELEEGFDLLSDVNLNVKIELGRTRMFLEDVLKLTEGSVVELDKLAGDPVDVYVNDRHVATGEVLILNDNFCVRVNEIISSAALENRTA